MAEKGFYYKKAKELVENEIDLETDIIDRTFTDLDHLAEYMMDTIDIEFTNIDDDDECEKDSDQHRIEIYDYLLTECKETVYKAIRVRTLFEILTEDTKVMDNFNNNIWDLVEELNEATPETLAAYERLYLTPDQIAERDRVYHID